MHERSAEEPAHRSKSAHAFRVQWRIAGALLTVGLVGPFLYFWPTEIEQGVIDGLQAARGLLLAIATVMAFRTFRPLDELRDRLDESGERKDRAFRASCRGLIPFAVAALVAGVVGLILGDPNAFRFVPWVSFIYYPIMALFFVDVFLGVFVLAPLAAYWFFGSRVLQDIEGGPARGESDHPAPDSPPNDEDFRLLKAVQTDLAIFSLRAAAVSLFLIVASILLMLIPPFNYMIFFMAMTQGGSVNTMFWPIHPATAYYFIQFSVITVGFIHYTTPMGGGPPTKGTQHLMMDQRARRRYMWLIGPSSVVAVFLLVEATFMILFRTGILYFELI